MKRPHFFLHDGAVGPIEYKTTGDGGGSVSERDIQTHVAL